MVRTLFFAVATASIVAIVALGQVWPSAWWALVVVGPLVVLGVHDVLQRKHALLCNYPVVGHFRYLLEEFRPEIQQYFIEMNTEGAPFSREHRSIVYRRAKGTLQTQPFGTERDVYCMGYEWMNHSLAPKSAPDAEPRVRVGGPDCDEPYEGSHLNISAMSYGSLSGRAIESLSRGARIGGFSHNTGEGGISPYHLAGGADLTWQIGTGYFGCRTLDGRFDPEVFAEKARNPPVRMIEIKLSQGAKPGHGGILPSVKVSAEIAAIRGVPMGVDVLSPPAHTAFDTPRGLLRFVAELRELSGGKPVGFKLCVGRVVDVLCVVKAMVSEGISPDFITVDGAEGGTGAAPLEFSNSVGMPLRDGLLLLHNALVGAGLRDGIRLIASGKIITGFHMVRALALGADLCNSARGMMFAVGCIQAQRCNANTCPVGVATTDERLSRGLSVEDKAGRVARFHAETVHAFLELVGVAGLEHPAGLGPEHVTRRVAHNQVLRFDQIYDFLEPGALIANRVPAAWEPSWEAASADRF